MPRPRIAALLDLAAFVTTATAARGETASAAERFDSLTRHLYKWTSRRAALEAALGGLLAALGLAEIEAACQPGEPCDCRQPGESCTANSQCCSKLCVRGTCVCRGGGQDCAIDANCCSKLCRRRTGTCACKGLRQTCSTNAACCSGTCRETAAPNKASCLSGDRCCLRLGKECKGDCDCCGIYPCRDVPKYGGPTCCIRPGQGLASLGCKPGKPCCWPAGCRGTLLGGQCCIPNGQPCSSSEECCFGPCTNGLC